LQEQGLSVKTGKLLSGDETQAKGHLKSVPLPKIAGAFETAQGAAGLVFLQATLCPAT